MEHCRWCRQSVDAACACKGKSPGRSSVSEENVALIRTVFQHRPLKSSQSELQLITTMWCVLRRWSVIKPLESLVAHDKRKRWIGRQGSGQFESFSSESTVTGFDTL